MIKTCLSCGKEFNIFPSEIKKGGGKFCSRKCRSEYGYEIRKCLNCGNQFKAIRYHIERNGGKFCSHRCQGNYYKTGKDINCLICGKSFYATKFEMDKGRKYCSLECRGLATRNSGHPYWKGGKKKRTCLYCKKGFMTYFKERKFCSKKCMINFNIGKNHPNWRGGISKLPYSFEFNDKLKERIRRRDDYVCQICEAKQNGKSFHVHHIDYNKMNNEEENLITLCSSCHMKTNFNREYWIEYFNQFRINKIITMTEKLNINVIMNGGNYAESKS